MNTFAKIGKTALNLLFSKMNIFGTVKIDGEKITFPSIPDNRIINISNEPIDLDGMYSSRQVITKGNYRREYEYKVYTWSVTTGLMEALLIDHEKKTLYSLVVFLHMRHQFPTHIVVAKRRSAFYSRSFSKLSESEEVTIYALTGEQKQLISDHVRVTNLRKFLNKESEGKLDCPIE